MAHLDYVPLTWYASLGLAGFRLLTQFIIKMIAILAPDRASKRALEVLRISWLEHVVSIVQGRADVRSPVNEAAASQGPTKIEPGAGHDHDQIAQAGNREHADQQVHTRE
jgi:hypothetical protein